MLSLFLLPLVALLFRATLAAPFEHQLQSRQTISIISNCAAGVSGQVALTFDDGPYLYEGQIAEVLQGRPFSLFINGNNFACIYDRAEELQALFAAGQLFGSHSWSHPDFTTLTVEQANRELELLETAFTKIFGVVPTSFRPPFGAYNDQTLAVLESRGYTRLVLWSDDTEDADGATPEASEAVLANIANNPSRPSAIVLAHSTVPTTVQVVLPATIPLFQSAGYQFVTVETCVGTSEPWYRVVGAPGVRDASWTCDV